MSFLIQNVNQDNLPLTNEKARDRRHADAHSQRQQNGKSIYFGDLLIETDTIAKKREMARSNAMKMIRRAFSSDQSVDEEINEVRSQKDTLLVENREMAKELKSIPDAKKELEERYSGHTESEDYQKDLQELMEREQVYRDTIAQKKDAVSAIVSSLTDIDIERLKSDPMVSASKQANEMILETEKEIAFDLLGEAKDNIDEKMEEIAEKIKEKAEQKEEEERQRAKEEEERGENSTASAIPNPTLPVSTTIKLASGQNKKPSASQDVMLKIGLLMEDLKGIQTDEYI